MKPLLQLFLDILFLRRGPQDVPVSAVLLVLVALAYGLLHLVLGWWEAGLSRAVLATGLDLGLTAGLLLLALRARGRAARFQQSFTAYLGTGFLLALLALPLLWVFSHTAGSAEVPLLAVLVWFALLFWSLSVLSHILRQALELPMPLTALMAIAYTLISMELSGRVLHGVA